MHILLMILKIIGILLLVILGVLLTLILLLLLVPFCYRGEGSYYESKPYVMARIRYLFPLLQVFVKYKDEELEGKVKLFGYTVYDFFAPKDENREPSPKKKKTNKKKTDESVPEMETKPKTETVKEEQAVSANMAGEVPATEMGTDKSEEKKQTLLEKIRVFIVTLKEKIVAFLQKLRDVKEKGLQTKEKISYYYGIWQREETQRAFQKAKSMLYKLWKRIRPKKGLVKFHFGTGDPGSTGQMCGYFGMLYPFIGKYVMIEPDFENKIYEGDFYLKGRITLFVFLKVAWVVLFDKDIKRLRNVLMNSDKEASYDK